MKTERYGSEKATAPDKVTRYVGPLEYVVDREFSPGHPPRRLTAEEAAAELNRLHAELAEARKDTARLDMLGRWMAKDTWADALQADSLNDMVMCGNDIRKGIDEVTGKEAAKAGEA